MQHVRQLKLWQTRQKQSKELHKEKKFEKSHQMNMIGGGTFVLLCLEMRFT